MIFADFSTESHWQIPHFFYQRNPSDLNASIYAATSNDYITNNTFQCKSRRQIIDNIYFVQEYMPLTIG